MSGAEIISSIISGIIAGIVVYLIQYYVEKRKQKKLEFESNRRGGRNNYFLDEDFLSKYEPGDIVIEKIIEELGQPISIEEESTDFNKVEELVNSKYVVYKYKFKNAIVLFTTLLNEKQVISITVRSTDPTHPIYCPLSPGSDIDRVSLGEALIDQEIIDNAVSSWTETFTRWGYSAIQSKYFYPHLNHLTYTYIVHDISIEAGSYSEFSGKRIDEICISQIESIHPYIYYYEK